MWKEYGKMGILVHYWQDCKLVQPLWKTEWRSLKILQIKLLYNPAIPLLETHPKKTETNFRRYLHSHVHSSNIICKLSKYESSLRVHQGMNGKKKKKRSCGKYIQWSIIQVNIIQYYYSFYSLIKMREFCHFQKQRLILRALSEISQTKTNVI